MLLRESGLTNREEVMRQSSDAHGDRSVRRPYRDSLPGRSFPIGGWGNDRNAPRSGLFFPRPPGPPKAEADAVWGLLPRSGDSEGPRITCARASGITIFQTAD
ncbi:hypothetical protein NL676_010024 [Syzygium grande]|nr:hypothetical protein NL676_010024 [Syzygium grande]